MEYPFVKLHGLGNDFIFIEDWDRSIEFDPGLIAFLCDRHKGIGADGVILVRPSDDPACAAYMHYINSDGSLAQMCGNGVRCFAKYLVDRRFVEPDAGRLVVDTLSGPKPITFTVDDGGCLTTASVDMGEPELTVDKIPLAVDGTSSLCFIEQDIPTVSLDSPWGAFTFSCVSMGNPHAVCFVESFDRLPDPLFDDPTVKTLETIDLTKIGAYFESHPAFPEKANIEFVDIREDGLHMRVYERGCGETLACGTGACAVNVAASLTKRASRENDVILRGGKLHVDWTDTNHVVMTGPAKLSFEGTIDLP